MKYIQKYYHLFRSNAFLKGSTLLFIGSTAVNVLSLLSAIIIARLLGPNLYGENSALNSIVYLASVPSAILATIAVKYTAKLNAQGEPKKIAHLLILLTRYALAITLIFFTITLIFHNQLVTKLKLSDSRLILQLTIMLALGFQQAIFNGIFQGMQQFIRLSALSGAIILLRIIFAVLFIFAGFSVIGVFYATNIASFIICILSALFIEQSLITPHTQSIPQRSRNYLKKIMHRTDSTFQHVKADILKFAPHSTATAFGLGMLVQADIILSKIYLPPNQAGIYASLAIVGKIIPFFTQPFVNVMFPQITEKITKKQNFLPLFSLVLIIVGGSSLLLAAIYNLLPQLLIFSIFGAGYKDAVPYIGLFSIFEVFYALITAFVYFFLGIGKNKIASTILFAGIAQAVGIMLYHQSIPQIIQVSTTICAIFVIIYAIQTVMVYKESKTNL